MNPRWLGGAFLAWLGLLTLLWWGHWFSLILLWAIIPLAGAVLLTGMGAPSAPVATPSRTPPRASGNGHKPAEETGQSSGPGSAGRLLSPTPPITPTVPPAPATPATPLAPPPRSPAPPPADLPLPAPPAELFGQPLPRFLELVIRDLATLTGPSAAGTPLEEMALDLLCPHLGIAQGQIYLIDPQKPEFLELRGCYPKAEWNAKRVRFEWGDTALAPLLKNGEMVSFWPARRGEPPPIAILLATPLIDGETVIGLLAIESAPPILYQKPDNQAALFLIGQVLGWMVAERQREIARRAEIYTLKQRIDKLTEYQRKLEHTTEYLDQEYDRQYFEKLGLEKDRAQMFESFQKFLSPHIVERIIADPGSLALGGQKQPVTIMFADVRGFTPLSEKLDPSQVVSLLNEYFSAMTEVILQFQGTIDKFIGDALMALFGAPLTVQDPERRAVFCAMTMLQRLDQLKAGWRKRGWPEIEIGIGLNTGDVTVGFIGSEKILSYTAIGDAVNIASRICSAARPGQILLSTTTAAGLGDLVWLEKLDPIPLKGKTQPVEIFQAIAPAQLPGFTEIEALLTVPTTPPPRGQRRPTSR
jgi:class 3 adenylate cyclase